MRLAAFLTPQLRERAADGLHAGQQRQAREIGNRIIKEYPEQAREWRIDEIVTRAWAGQ